MSTDDQQAIDRDALADDVVERLEPGTVIDNKIVLSRRQLLAISGTGLGAGALAALGVDGAEAQSAAGQVGTESGPLNSYMRNNYSVQQSSSPSAPPSGYVDLYAKDDGGIYKQTPDGTESEVGSGLSDGENFDGQGTSQFSNLQSLDTETANGIQFYSGYSSLQAAIDAADRASDDPQTPVYIDDDADSRSDAIDEAVTLNGWSEIRGYGINTRVTATGAHTFTVPSGEEDGHVHSLWLDNDSADTYDALHINESEWLVGPHLDIDSAGRHGVYVDGRRTEVVGARFYKLTGASSCITLDANATDATIRANYHDGGVADPVNNGVQLEGGADRADVHWQAKGLAGTGLTIKSDRVRATVNLYECNRGVHIQSTASWATLYGRSQNATNQDLLIDGDDCHIFGRFDEVEVTSNAQDTRLWGRFALGVTDNGTRTLINGWGTNAGDPNSTGDWNGSGEEGVNVYDTTNNTPYAFVGGSWRAL